MRSFGDSGNGYRYDDDQHVIVQVLLGVRSSFLAFVVALGVVFLVVAVVLSEHVPLVHNGVLSGMFLVWGVSAFVYAALGHLLLGLIGYR